MESEKALLSRGSRDRGQESRPAAEALASNPVSLPSPGSAASCLHLPFSGPPASTGDDNSTYHTGLLQVNPDVDSGRRGFSLDRMAWLFWNRMFCRREQRRPVSESEARNF